MDNSDELRRLLAGPGSGEKPRGLLAEFFVECENSASQKTLQAVQEVLTTVLSQADLSKLSLEEWREILPKDFLKKFGPEIELQEALRRRSLPMEERVRLAETWSLSAWVHWLRASERQWAWWDAEIESHSTLRVKVVVDGFPFPSGSLEWLLKCCGARSVELVD